MKLTFITTSAEVNPSINITAEAPTILQCLAKLEIQITALTCAEFSFSTDMGFDATKAIKAIENGETYFRSDFSTPEENFSLIEDWNGETINIAEFVEKAIKDQTDTGTSRADAIEKLWSDNIAETLLYQDRQLTANEAENVRLYIQQLVNEPTDQHAVELEERAANAINEDV